MFSAKTPDNIFLFFTADFGAFLEVLLRRRTHSFCGGSCETSSIIAMFLRVLPARYSEALRQISCLLAVSQPVVLLMLVPFFKLDDKSCAFPALRADAVHAAESIMPIPLSPSIPYRLGAGSVRVFYAAYYHRVVGYQPVPSFDSSSAVRFLFRFCHKQQADAVNVISPACIVI